MEKYTLAAEARTERGRAARSVAGARIPATVYGHGEPMAIWLPSAAFARVFAAAGETSVIEITVDGEKKPMPAIVRELQRDPLKYSVTHVDFYRVSMKEKVNAEVPVVFTGDSAAVKSGGTLMHGTDTIEVSALPADLPHEITVDISTLATYDDSITVADITVSEKVEVLADPSTMVASVAAPRVEKEEDETPAEEATSEEEPAE